jgi:hypothetical protein
MGVARCRRLFQKKKGARAEVSRKDCSAHKTIGLRRIAASQTRIAGCESGVRVKKRLLLLLRRRS